MSFRMIIPCIAVVLSAMPKTDCFFVERLSTVIQPQCNEEIRISKLRANNNEHKSFFLQSDSFAESVLAGN